MNEITPKVHIGIPVHNGESYIQEALDSVLAQTFRDFEVIISDNASTDRTEEICRRYTQKDARISYYRNEKNIGAAPNFNRVLDLATAPYFQWFAHDDILAPQFLKKCVEILNNHPEIVLCHSKVKEIDASGQFIQKYPFLFNGTDDKAFKRIKYQIKGHQCYEVFGLMRREVLLQTAKMGNYAGGDAVLLVRLNLIGKFYEIPEYLFFSRRHSTQSGTMKKDFQQWAHWFDPKNKRKINFPYWRIFSEYYKSVKQSHLRGKDRVFTYFYVWKWCGQRWRLLSKDIIKAVLQLLSVLYLKILKSRRQF